MFTRRDAEALADPTRFRLLTELRGSAHALAVTELAERLGVHHTSVRRHLAVLRAAGLIEESTAPPTGRGRPKLLYSATTEPEAIEGGYRALASMLADALRSGRSAEEEGYAAGRALSEAQLVDLGSAGSEPIDALEQSVEATRRIGFRPQVEVHDDGERLDVVLRSCPFADVASEDPATVCALHYGMARGLTESLGEFEVTGLTVEDPQHAGCRIHLRAREAGDTGTPPSS